jgi:hypothetical protein
MGYDGQDRNSAGEDKEGSIALFFQNLDSAFRGAAGTAPDVATQTSGGGVDQNRLAEGIAMAGRRDRPALIGLGPKAEKPKSWKPGKPL